MSFPPMLVATKDMSVPVFNRFMGIATDQDGPPVPTSLREFAAAPADEPWVYSCLNKIFVAAQSVPLRVYVKKGRDRTPIEESNRGDGKDLQYLLDNVNDASMNGADFKGYTAAGYGAWGGSYWKKVRGVRGGPPQQLYWLPAPDVTPNKDPAAVGVVKSFTYQPEGTSVREEYAARDVLAFRRFNLRDTTQLLSPLSAGRYDISVSRQATMAAAHSLANWSIPPGAWVPEKDEEISPQDQRLITRIFRRLRGPGNAGKVPVLPVAIKWTQMGLSPQDAQWLQGRQVSRLTVCGLLEVPLLLAGDDASTGPYAYAREIKRLFWESMIGRLDQAADTINGWLVPDFDKTRTLEVGFDYGEIEALQPSVIERQQMALSEIDHRATTVNEYRREFKRGPDVKWGDDPVLSTRLDPQTPEGEPLPIDRIAATPEQPAPTNAPADAVAPMKHLYTLPEVAAFQSGQPLDLAFLGVPVTEAQKAVIETGLRRRYSSSQIANGVSAESYPGLRGIPA